MQIDALCKFSFFGAISRSFFPCRCTKFKQLHSSSVINFNDSSTGSSSGSGDFSRKRERKKRKMKNKCNVMGNFIVFLYFTTLIMLSLALTETTVNPDELQGDVETKITEGVDHLVQQAINFFDGIKRHVDMVFKIINYVVLVVLIGSIFLCIISPIVYIVATLIKSINKCIMRCRENKGQKEGKDYVKLNERITYIEINNGLKPAMDNNQNTGAATGGDESQLQKTSVKNVKEGSGGGTTGAASGPAESVAKSAVDPSQQKS